MPSSKRKRAPRSPAAALRIPRDPFKGLSTRDVEALFCRIHAAIKDGAKIVFETRGRPRGSGPITSARTKVFLDAYAKARTHGQQREAAITVGIRAARDAGFELGERVAKQTLTLAEKLFRFHTITRNEKCVMDAVKSLQSKGTAFPTARDVFDELGGERSCGMSLRTVQRHCRSKPE